MKERMIFVAKPPTLWRIMRFPIAPMKDREALGYRVLRWSLSSGGAPRRPGGGV
jgi:hypothetical protein